MAIGAEASPPMNMDRYITDEVLAAVREAQLTLDTEADVRQVVLRAALPTILAQHRADVLREAAERTTREGQRFEKSAQIAQAAEANRCAVWLLRLADEGVAQHSRGHD